jgi:hypothetical protein
VGRFFSLDTPLAAGPLHCGQFAPSSTNADDRKSERGDRQTIKMRVRPDVIGLNNTDLISTQERLRIEVIYDSAVGTEKFNQFAGRSIVASTEIFRFTFLFEKTQYP